MGNIPLYISIIVLIELFVLDITQSVGVNTDFIPGYTTFPRDKLHTHSITILLHIVTGVLLS